MPCGLFGSSKNKFLIIFFTFRFPAIRLAARKSSLLQISPPISRCHAAYLDPKKTSFCDVSALFASLRLSALRRSQSSQKNPYILLEGVNFSSLRVSVFVLALGGTKRPWRSLGGEGFQVLQICRPWRSLGGAGQLGAQQGCQQRSNTTGSPSGWLKLGLPAILKTGWQPAELPAALKYHWQPLRLAKVRAAGST